MKGVIFGNYHSYNDFGLILSKKEIGSPNPKVVTIDVEGSDGVLDLTEAFGDVKFRNRSLSFQFAKASIDPHSFLELYSTVHNAIHGKKMHIILDDDMEFYYVGRITVNEWTSDKNIGKIVIDVDAEPWKYKLNETVVAKTISGSGTVNLLNQRKPVVPSVRATASMTFSFDGNSYAIGANTTTIFPSFELKAGNNSVSVTGTGTITFTYQEGGL